MYEMQGTKSVYWEAGARRPMRPKAVEVRWAWVEASQEAREAATILDLTISFRVLDVALGSRRDEMDHANREICHASSYHSLQSVD